MGPRTSNSRVCLKRSFFLGQIKMHPLPTTILADSYVTVVGWQCLVGCSFVKGLEQLRRTLQPLEASFANDYRLSLSVIG